MNNVQLIGRLTADPRSNTSTNGYTFCRFSIAVNRYVKDKGNACDYINIISMGKIAENCLKYLRKGSQVAIDGRIQTGSYEKDGVKHQTFDVFANNIEFLTKISTEATQTSLDELKEIEESSDMPF